MAAIDTFYRVVPALGSLRGYKSTHFRADLVAGLSVAAVAVPQAMAYALIAGLPVEYGLYTAIVMTFVGALFDSSKQLINGPTNAISIALLSAIGSITDPDVRIHAAIFMALMIGLIQLTITALRFGDLSRYISHSVIVGFTLGAGSLLPLDQMKNLLGLKAMGDPHDAFLVRFYLTMTQGGDIHKPTLIVGLSTAALVILLRLFKRKMGWKLLPEFLIAVVVSAAVSAALHLDQQGVKVVGDIPAKLPSFQIPTFESGWWNEFGTSALAIALLGLLEATSMAKAIAAKTHQKLDVNQQCLSDGLANTVGAFFQCFPGSGSLTRSSINQQAGAVSQWAGVISAVAVAVTVVLFAPWARYVPKSALSGILLVSAYGMVDWTALRTHLRATRFDAIIVLATAIAAVAISVEFCVLIGVLASFMLTVPRAGRMLRTEFVVTPEHVIHERMADEPVCSRVLVFGLEGEMFFGSSAVLEQHLEDIEARVVDQVQIVVLRLKRVRNPDAVSLHVLEGFLHRLEDRGIIVLLCGVREELRAALDSTGILERRSNEHVFVEQPVRNTSTHLAIRHAHKLVGVHPCSVCTEHMLQEEQELVYQV